MDNLTHSLIGAALGQAGLKRTTGLAMPALIIAANLPDIDAPFVLLGTELLAIRRGITHGPIALAVLPVLLAGALIGYDRWQTRRGARPPDRPTIESGWLIALCYIGMLTHLLFDWFNNYGIRLLEPFSSEWFYGDTLFIIDPWIWAMLGAAVWLSLKREKRDTIDPAWPARNGMIALVGYLAINLAISRSIAWNARMSEPYPEVVLTNPVPVAFWQREVIWRSNGVYGSYMVTFPLGRSNASAPEAHNMGDPRIARWAEGNSAAKAFLFWSRMPLARVSTSEIELRDQRFENIPTRAPFRVRLTPPPSPLQPAE